MRITKIPNEVAAARRLRIRKNLADLDYRRALRSVRDMEEDVPQRTLAVWLKISQPSVNTALNKAAEVSLPRSGFSGASPYELCERFAVGGLTKDALVDELTRWDYAPRDRTDGIDDLLSSSPGSWSEVEGAFHDGLIDIDVYTEIFEAQTKRT